MHAYIHTQDLQSMDQYTHVHTYTRMHTYMHTYIHTYIHTQDLQSMDPVAPECIDDATAQAFELRQHLQNHQNVVINPSHQSSSPVKITAPELSDNMTEENELLRMSSNRNTDMMDLDDDAMPALMPN